MKSIDGISLSNVREVYSGPEGDLWELVMGQQIHIGGFVSSTDLAEKADIQAGSRGVDLCGCNGAGMRFLIRFRGVEGMCGVDATETVVERGRRRCEEEGMAEKIEFVLADACDSGLPDGAADFVWGEDAWCYVADKGTLISEAARLVRSGGTVAFTDWVESSPGLDDAEAERFCRFMKFPGVQDINGYTELLSGNECDVLVAADTGRFAPHVDLYINMLEMQLSYDALRIIGFDVEMMQSLAEEMAFMQKLAHEGKIAQGIFVARKK